MDPETGYKPFEVVEKDGRPVLRLHGTRDQRAKVEADKVRLIMDAIAQGWDIDIKYADIEGDLDITMIAKKLEPTEEGKLVIKGSIRMYWCNISGDADFRFAQFSRYASFDPARFGGDADFRFAQFSRNASFGFAQFSRNASFNSAQFSGNMDFSSAQFSGNVNFSSAQFSGDADFRFAQFTRNASFGFAQFSRNTDFRFAQFARGARFSNIIIARPANFADITFYGNHVIKGLWNATLGRIKRLHWQATDFSGFNTERVMDGASNPWLKRYIDDELWIQSWRKRSWWREPLFTIWELTSHCGRSIGLWAFWSALIATVFAFVYRAFGPANITFNIAQLSNFQPDLWDYLYYSVVTFTTLGFGDIVPLTKPARLAVGAEVVLGYVMLGGLISIFANKLARRS